jgi:zinc protease
MTTNFKRMILVGSCLFFSGCNYGASADQLDLQSYTSPKGHHFALAKSEIQDTIALSFAFECGLVCDEAKTYAAGYVATATARSGGTLKLSAAETSESFRDAGARLNLSANSDQTYIDLVAPSRGIDRAVALANQVLTTPVLPEKTMLRLREQMAKQREEMELSAEVKAFASFVEAGVNADGYVQYFSPRAADLRAVDLAQLKPWLANHLVTKNLLVSVMGDITKERAGELVDVVLKDLPAEGPLKFPEGGALKAVGLDVVRIKGDGGAQAVVNFGSINKRPATLQEWLTGNMLAKIFAEGSKSRLFADVREKIGATYGLELDFNFYENMAMNRVSGRVGLDKLDQALTQMRLSWKTFRENGPTDAEINDAKTAMFNEINGATRDHGRAAGLIRDYLTGHWTSDEIANMPSLIMNADLKDKALLAKLFPTNPIVVVAQ